VIQLPRSTLEHSPSYFWIYTKKENLELATEVLVVFGMTHLSDETFSAVAAFKSNSL
jgi:hypothetical protein